MEEVAWVTCSAWVKVTLNNLVEKRVSKSKLDSSMLLEKRELNKKSNNLLIS